MCVGMWVHIYVYACLCIHVRVVSSSIDTLRSIGSPPSDNKVKRLNGLLYSVLSYLMASEYQDTVCATERADSR